MGNANIHSFGYESDWASTKSSILSVHDFGQSLLEEIRNSPFLRDGKSVSPPVSSMLTENRVSELLTLYRDPCYWSGIPWVGL